MLNLKKVEKESALRISHAHQIYNKSAAIENPKTTSFVKLSEVCLQSGRLLSQQPVFWSLSARRNLAALAGSDGHAVRIRMRAGAAEAQPAADVGVVWIDDLRKV